MRDRRKERLPLSGGRYLRLLTAAEVLAARREAEKLAGEGGEAALWANACLLARALARRGRPVFADGAAVLAALTVSQVQELAEKWARWDREVNPGLDCPEERWQGLKKAWSTRRQSGFGGVCSSVLGLCPQRRGRKR